MKNVRKRRFLAAFLAFILVAVGIPITTNGIIVKAATYDLDKDGFLDKDTTVITIGGQEVVGQSPVQGEIKVDYGDTVKVELGYRLPNKTDASFYSTDDVFTYDLPDNITFDNTEGQLKSGDTVVGKFTINEGKVSIQYQGEAGQEFLNKTDITGTIRFDGVIDGKAAPNGEGGEAVFDFPGISPITVTVNRDTSKDGVKVEKKDPVSVGGDPFKKEFILTITSSYINTNVSVKDSMDTTGKFLSLDTAEGVAFYKDEECTQPYEGTVTKNSVNETGFDYTIGSMQDGEVIYVKYYVDVDKEQAVNPAWQTGSNKVAVHSDEKPNDNTSEKSVDYKMGNWISKSGKYDEKTKTITWTIIVAATGDKDVDISGTVLKDVLGNNLTEPTSISVEESDRKVNSWDTENVWMGSSIALTWDDLLNGYTFPAGSKKAYKITYTTEVEKTPAIGIEERTNDATVNAFGNPDWGKTTGDTKVTVGTKVDLIDKANVEFNSETNEISWKTTIKIPAKSTMTNLIYTDTVTSGEHSFISGSDYKITPSNDSLYKGTPVVTGMEDNSTKYTISFGTVTNESDTDATIVIEYKTKITEIPDKTTDFVNEAKVECDELKDPQTETAKHTYTVFDFSISKSKVENWDNDPHHTANGLMAWKISTNKAIPNGTKNLVFTDTLPDNSEYYAGSAVVRSSDWNYTLYGKPDVNISEDGKTVEFTIPDSMLESIYGKSIVISYQTKIKDFNVESTSATYKNSVYLTIDGYKTPSVFAENTYDFAKDLLNKTYKYDENTAPLIEYTVNINQSALDLIPGADTLILSDVMGSAMELKMGSVKADGVDITQLGDQYGYSYDHSTNTLSIKVPDEKAITITYNAKVTLAVGSALNANNASNTVNFTGGINHDVQGYNFISGVVLSSSGTTQGVGNTISVYKYADGVVTSQLKGAEYQIYIVEIDSNGKVTDEIDVTPQVELTTGTDGYGSYAGLSKDKIYKLVESKAPTGYIIDTTPYYFVFNGQNGINYPENIIGTDSKESALTVIVEEKDAYTYQLNNNQIPKATTGAISITKKNADGTLSLGGAEFEVYQNGTTIKVGTITTGDGTNGTTLGYGTLSDLPEGTYTVKEVKAPTGYKLNTVAFANEYTVVVTAGTTTAVKSGDNEYISNQKDTTNVNVEKKWVDNNNSDNKRPASIEVVLTRDGKDTETKLTLNEANNWKATFENLDVTDEKGTAYTYGVKEVAVTDYTSAVSGDAKNGFTITNTIIEKPTEAPTTVAPTTVAPTTVAPTTVAPTTVAPTTVAPTTVAPTTVAPTTVAPTTVAPTTVAPTTVAPTTEAPTTEAPTTVAPTTEAPTTEAPTTEAPTTEAPTTEAPTTEAPTTETPTTVAPTTVAPTTVAPTTVAPTTETPTTIAPTTETPTTIAPTTVAPTEPTVESATEPTTGPDNNNPSADTGDRTSAIPFVLLIVLSLTGTIVVFSTKKKKINK